MSIGEGNAYLFVKLNVECIVYISLNIPLRYSAIFESMSIYEIKMNQLVQYFMITNQRGDIYYI